MLLPRNSSRTSTHAVIVPTTALTAATSSAAPRLSFRAATACGSVTTVQNWCSPSCREAQMSAAIGNSTITDRYAVVKPSERAVVAPSLGRRAVRRRAAAGACAVLARGRASDAALDRDHAALVRVEPELVGLAPAAERLVVDREDAWACRVLVGVLPGDGLVDGAEAVLGEEILCGRALHEADELVHLVLVRARLRDRDRQLDQHRLARDHVLDVLAVEARVDRLALVGDQHVAAACEERVRRVAAGGVLRDDVLEEVLHVRGRLLVGLAEVALRAVGGEHVPLRRARAERVGGDDVDPLAGQVGPALDVLRVAVPDREDDERVGCDAVVALPIPLRVDDAAVDEQVDVGAGG